MSEVGLICEEMIGLNTSVGTVYVSGPRMKKVKRGLSHLSVTNIKVKEWNHYLKMIHCPTKGERNKSSTVNSMGYGMNSNGNKLRGISEDQKIKR